ncbi:hypothetical protein SKAU_G00006680 [Synaphobranchus kaupii]|uniref:Uncharacterized protein n=1 Tax=Synaphobranchus kaupii TaxID=118154 RepID=A0A9Q1JCJ3_SYNKA|nr:hypothetical protein SKAU_G00006680 [Synaphobranchus kaupii]
MKEALRLSLQLSCRRGRGGEGLGEGALYQRGGDRGRTGEQRDAVRTEHVCETDTSLFGGPSAERGRGLTDTTGQRRPACRNYSERTAGATPGQRRRGSHGRKKNPHREAERERAPEFPSQPRRARRLISGVYQLAAHGLLERPRTPERMCGCVNVPLSHCRTGLGQSCCRFPRQVYTVISGRLIADGTQFVQRPGQPLLLRLRICARGSFPLVLLHTTQRRRVPQPDGSTEVPLDQTDGVLACVTGDSDWMALCGGRGRIRSLSSERLKHTHGVGGISCAEPFGLFPGYDPCFGRVCGAPFTVTLKPRAGATPLPGQPRVAAALPRLQGGQGGANQNSSAATSPPPRAQRHGYPRAGFPPCRGRTSTTKQTVIRAGAPGEVHAVSHLTTRSITAAPGRRRVRVLGLGTIWLLYSGF